MSPLDPGQLEIRQVSHLQFRKGWTLREHAHAEVNEMILVIAGEIETHIAGEVLRGPAGSVLIYPRGVRHRERAVGGSLHLMLAVWRERDGSRLPDNWPLISSDTRGRIRELIEWLHEVPPGAPATPSALLHCALTEFGRGVEPSPDDPITRVSHHINRNFAQKITLESLAKIAHQSPYHFARQFHRRTGQPPMRYVRQVRVEAAKTLVLTSPLPLRAIAPMVGLVDEYHLSRVFRAVIGHPPSRLRRPSRR